MGLSRESFGLAVGDEPKTISQTHMRAHTDGYRLVCCNVYNQSRGKAEEDPRSNCHVQIELMKKKESNQSSAIVYATLRLSFLLFFFQPSHILPYLSR